MNRINKKVDCALVGIVLFVCGFLLSHCTTEPEIVEKPVEVVKEVVVEKPVEVIKYKTIEKVVYRDIIPQEFVDDPLIWSDEEMTDEKGKELLESGDLYCYYVLNHEGELRLRTIFHKGQTFHKFEAVGMYPIIYSSEDLIK